MHTAHPRKTALVNSFFFSLTISQSKPNCSTATFNSTLHRALKHRLAEVNHWNTGLEYERFTVLHPDSQPQRLVHQKRGLTNVEQFGCQCRTRSGEGMFGGRGRYTTSSVAYFINTAWLKNIQRHWPGLVEADFMWVQINICELVFKALSVISIGSLSKMWSSAQVSAARLSFLLLQQNEMRRVQTLTTCRIIENKWFRGV